jgi:hypothetical protein
MAELAASLVDRVVLEVQAARLMEPLQPRLAMRAVLVLLALALPVALVALQPLL